MAAKKKATKKVAKKTSRKSKSMKMKSYASFDLWIEDQSPVVQEIIQALRKLVNAHGKGMIEAIKWGNGCWVKEELPITFIYADRDHVQFGFFIGSQLKDPKGLLSGNGKYVRAIKIWDRSEIKKVDFVALLKQAMKIKYR